MPPIHLPNYAPIKVPPRTARELLNTPLGAWELHISSQGDRYELRAHPAGKPTSAASILITVPASALRDYMARARALRSEGIVIGDEHGLADIAAEADWSGADWIYGTDEVGGFFDSLWKGAKNVLKSKAFKTIGAIASSDVGRKLLATIPGIGAAAPYIGPTMTTLSSAATMLDEAKGKAGPTKQRAARRSIVKLQADARIGKPRARAALGAVLAVAKARKLGGHSIDALKFLPRETRRVLVEAAAPAVEDVLPNYEVDAYAPLAWPGEGGFMPPTDEEVGAAPFRFRRPAYGYHLMAA